MKTFPTLYHKSKTGAIIEWNLSVDGSKITTVWGQSNGKKQTSELICTPKNEGRSNETNAEEQAIKEAEAQWKYQLDRKYRLTPEESEEVILFPMLARSKSVQRDENCSFPCHIQPKFDGLRCMAMWDNDEIILMSRNGKPYTVPHISEELKSILPKDTILDGELYVHGLSFQSISSWCKRVQPDTAKVCYRVYDCPTCEGINGRIWEERFEDLKDIVGKGSDFISVCETKKVYNMDEVFEYQSECVADGYEGAILRTLNGRYLWGQRSRHELLKVKLFVDDEFEIIGYKSGLQGTKEENAVIWKCKTKTGKEFFARPSGSIEDREEKLKEADKYIGKFYTVKFFEYTDDGNLRFPVGEGFKEDR